MEFQLLREFVKHGAIYITQQTYTGGLIYSVAVRCANELDYDTWTICFGTPQPGLRRAHLWRTSKRDVVNEIALRLRDEAHEAGDDISYEIFTRLALLTDPHTEATSEDMTEFREVLRHWRDWVGELQVEMDEMPALPETPKPYPWQLPVRGEVEKPKLPPPVYK